MSEKINTLEIIDETIKAVEDISDNFSKIIEVLRTAKKDLRSLEQQKNNLSIEKESLEKEKIQLEEEKKRLEKATEELSREKEKLEKDKEQLERDKEQLEKEKQERDQKIGALTEEQKRLLEEYEKVREELKKFMKAAEEAEEAEYNFERIQALLSIYSVLVSEIWQGYPHYKILKILHGDKEAMTRDEIKNATGIGGAFILKAIHDLANVNLVEYDDNKDIVKLKRRLFENQSLEK
ncbi:MAG: coiled-coil domain-containing protein [Promethearchaeota archaeon]